MTIINYFGKYSIFQGRPLADGIYRLNVKGSHWRFGRRLVPRLLPPLVLHRSFMGSLG